MSCTIKQCLEKPGVKRWLWFIGLYLGSIIAVGAFVMICRLILGLPV